jgi:AraC family transcriptional regulator
MLDFSPRWLATEGRDHLKERPLAAEVMAVKLAPGAFYGETHEAREINGLIFSESVYPPNFETEMHEHSNPFLAFVLAGACLERYRHRSGICSAATLTTYPHGEQHASRWSTDGGACFHIEITTIRLELLRQHVPVLTDPLECRGGLPAWLVGRLHREYRRAESVSPLIMESLTLEILAETARGQEASDDARGPRWLRQVVELLHDRSAEPLSLAAIAEEIGVNPSHLSRTFRRFHRSTPGEYLRKLRADRAFRLLGDPAKSLEEVARSVGFEGVRVLSRAFKREFGLAASAFRGSVVAHKSGAPISKSGQSEEFPWG